MFKIPGSVSIRVVPPFPMIIIIIILIIIHMVLVFFLPKHTYGLLYCLFKPLFLNGNVTNYDDLVWKSCSV